MKIDEWIKYHDEKANKRCNIPIGLDRVHPNCPPGQEIITDSTNGAVQYFIDGSFIYITGIVGNVQHWNEVINEIAKASKCTHLIGYTCATRPKAVARLTGFKITRTWTEMIREV